MMKGLLLPEPVSTDEIWENLANAIVERAVLDYEAVISDAPLTSYIPSSVTETEIRNFANTQTLTPLDVNAILDKVKQVHRDEFRPYVKEHWREILKDWEWVQKARTAVDLKERLKKYKHNCPFCGKPLKPMNGTFDRRTRRTVREPFIVCTYCNLNARYKEV